MNNFDFLSRRVESCASADFPSVVEKEVGERMRRLGCDFYAGQNTLAVCEHFDTHCVHSFCEK